MVRSGIGAAATVAAAFRRAAGHMPAFLVAHVALRVVASAVLLPLAGLGLAVVLSRAGAPALTDQDIARFLLTPAGFAGLLAVLSVGIVAAVLDLAVMSNAYRTGTRGARATLLSGLGLIVSRLPKLVVFNALLVLRLVLLVAPFAAAGGLAALPLLGRHDINYYLTYWPPEFVAVAVVVGALALGLAVLLLARLASWAVALHLVLFEGTRPWRAFGDSARLLSGGRRTLVAELALWFAVRIGIGAAVTLVLGLLAETAQDLLGARLRALALSSLAVFALWSLANAALAALSNGALAAILDARFRKAVPQPTLVRPVPQPRRGMVALAATAALALLLAGGGVTLITETLGRVTADRTVEIIAHRGAAATRPENTMAAVLQALDDRADWVEIDVQESADGEVIVAHDSDFMKLAGNPLKVWDATAADLAAIDIGSWFGPEWADERTPTLREVLRAARGRGKVMIELKYYGHDTALEERVARIVEEEGMADAVSVMSLKIGGVRKMQAIRPGWRYGILAARAIGNLSALEADFLAVNTGQVTPRLIRAAHAQGKQVYVWTVDDAAVMSRMISMGVDGLITNEPALARQVMEARNALTAPERLILWVTGRLRLESFDLVEDESEA